MHRFLASLVTADTTVSSDQELVTLQVFISHKARCVTIPLCMPPPQSGPVLLKDTRQK